MSDPTHTSPTSMRPPEEPFEWYSRGAMVAAVLLWLATAVAAVLLSPDWDAGINGSAYSLGRALGAFSGGLLIAAVIRLIYVRLTPWGYGLPDVMPAFFVLAAVVTVMGTVGRSALDEDEVDRYTASADECVSTQSSPLAGAPAGMTMAPIPPAAQAQFDQMASESVAEEVSDRLELRQVVVDGRVSAVVMVMPGVTGQDRADFEAGMSASVPGGFEHAMVGNWPATVASSPTLTAVTTYPGCWGLVIMGPDRAAAEDITKALLPTAPV